MSVTYEEYCNCQYIMMAWVARAWVARAWARWSVVVVGNVRTCPPLGRYACVEWTSQSPGVAARILPKRVANIYNFSILVIYSQKLCIGLFFKDTQAIEYIPWGAIWIKMPTNLVTCIRILTRNCGINYMDQCITQ